MSKTKRQRFTAVFIDNLKPRATAYREFDGRGAGFGIQVFPSGHKTWFYVFRDETGKQRYLGLGSPGPKCGDSGTADQRFVSLADAYAKALDKGKESARGLDPKEQDRIRDDAEKAKESAAKAARESERRVGTMSALVEAYSQSLRDLGRVSAPEVERMLKRDALPALGATTKASAITADHIADLYDEVKKTYSVKANRLLSYLSGAFRYAREHDRKARRTDGVLFGVTHNPARGEIKRTREKAAKRALNFTEVRQLWAALTTAQFSGEIAFFLRFLLATGGQRVRETLRLDWAEVNFDSRLWDMPAEKTKGGWKNDLGHVVPLTWPAIDALEAVRVYNPTGLVFKGRGQGLRDASVNRALKRWREKHTPSMPAFTTRDLRRTFKTLGGQLGLSKEVRDRVQSHKVQDTSNQNYDRFDYADQKRQALEAWCTALTQTPAQDNVRPLRKVSRGS